MDITPQDALIIAHPLDLNYFLSLIQKPIKKEPLYLAKLFYFPSLMVIGPCLGTSQLILILEKIAKNIKKILFWGWCGGISSDLKIGDVILAKEAGNNEKLFLPDDSFFCFISSKLSLPYHSGLVYSIENPFEFNEKLAIFYQKLGVIAIDMETVALYEFSVKRQIQVLSMLMVSDLFVPIRQEGFLDPLFKKTRKAIAQWFAKQTIVVKGFK